MFAYLTAVVLLVCSPGPGVLSTAGIGAAFGFNSGYRYVAGLFFGNNFVGLIVVSGYAAVMLSIPWLRFVLLT
ncbi:MAG: LysE family translocator, partial [Pseudomonadota bacterium]